MQETKKSWRWVITSWLLLAVAFGVAIWFYAYRVSALRIMETWATHCGQLRAKVWFEEGRYRLLETSTDERDVKFTGRMEGPFEIWAWRLDRESIRIGERAYVDALNSEMKRLWKKAAAQTNRPNQTVEQDGAPPLSPEAQ